MERDAFVNYFSLPMKIFRNFHREYRPKKPIPVIPRGGATKAAPRLRRMKEERIAPLLFRKVCSTARGRLGNANQCFSAGRAYSPSSAVGAAAFFSTVKETSPSATPPYVMIFTTYVRAFKEIVCVLELGV